MTTLTIPERFSLWLRRQRCYWFGHPADLYYEMWEDGTFSGWYCRRCLQPIENGEAKA